MSRHARPDDDVDQPSGRDLARRACAIAVLFATIALAVLLLRQQEWATAKGTVKVANKASAYTASVAADGTVYRQNPVPGQETRQTRIGPELGQTEVRGTDRAASAGQSQLAALLTSAAALAAATLAFQTVVGRWRWRLLLVVTGALALVVFWLVFGLPGRTERHFTGLGVTNLVTERGGAGGYALLCVLGALGAAVLGDVLAERAGGGRHARVPVDAVGEAAGPPVRGRHSSD